MSDDITVRNTYGTRIRGGPAGHTIHAGDEVSLPHDVAEYYIERYGFVRVDEDDVDGEEETTDADDPVEICGAEMSDGDICERPADDCPYHGDGA